MAERIALYGGSFNPIHHGHLIVARSIAEVLELDRVVFLPSRTPPHKRNHVLAPADHRAAMVQVAIAGDALFGFSDHDLTCDGPSYTAHTVAAFRAKHPPPAELCWIVGADSLLELHTWYKPEEIARSCRIVTARRPGAEVGDVASLRRVLDDDTVARLLADVIETPHIGISSTDIRNRVARGRSIRYLVPDAVTAYIERESLYRRAD